MEHSFNVDDAIKLGIEKAVIIKNLSFWIAKNVANKKHFYDGFYWTYNSTVAFAELFPYMSAQKIGRLLRELESEGFIKTGNYNKAGYDRTKWYTIPSLLIVQNQTMDILNLNNGLFESEQPIPDGKPDSKHICFNSILELWNSLAEESSKASRHRDFPEKAKRDLPKTYKKYKEICKREGSEPKQLEQWLESYFGAVIEFRNCWSENITKKVNLEYACRIDTYDKVLEWAHND